MTEVMVTVVLKLDGSKDDGYAADGDDICDEGIEGSII